jgi:hypothetical protein
MPCGAGGREGPIGETGSPLSQKERPPGSGLSRFDRDVDLADTTVISPLRERRKAPKPSPAKPNTIIVQVEGSGMVVIAPGTEKSICFT